MNLGAHIAVVDHAFAADGAERSDDDAARLLGSALPDLATIGRFRLLGSTDHAATTDGIALHHRTDDLFHGHPWFTQRNRDLTDTLTEAGVARGPAMACSHVGIELLLDGRLTAEPDIREANDDAFAAIAPLRDRLISLVPPTRQREWSDFLDRLSDRPDPPDYRDPETVAVRLHRILATRPRLALPNHQIGVVTTALAARQTSIANTAIELVADIAQRLPAARKGAGRPA
ncbi:MAG: hypothetical protein ACR2QO_24320 [Acidimicrobiales bacterium]